MRVGNLDVFLLGAGRPARGLRPSALKHINLANRALDWQQSAFRDAIDEPNIHFLGGYQVQSVVDKYPHYVDGETDKTFLYTGGGIVPATLLAVPNSRFIHVHPGFLPDIRGADELLWSILTKRRPSAPAFYMAPGIDTGNIIAAHWLPDVHAHIDAGIDTLTRYRMAYALIDPWVRCRVLRGLIENNMAFENIPATAQDEMDGTTYHFMHDQLRRMAQDKLFGRA